jgi:methylglyoxal synthase
MIVEDFVTFEIDQTKHIALVAHDGKKKELVDWCEKNQGILKGHFLCGTGTTARLIADRTGLPVKAYNSGPLGGDQQIGAKIAEGQVDFIVFLWDPLEAQPHDPDVKALLRIAVVYDIPIANNLATADFMLHSKYMDEVYSRRVENFDKTIQNRVEKLK